MSQSVSLDKRKVKAEENKSPGGQDNEPCVDTI